MAQRTRTASGTRLHKIVVLGEGGAGKSALTMQYVRHEFIDYHNPTLEDEYTRKTTVDDILVELDILDTGGSNSYSTRSIRRQYLRGAEGFLIVYSVADKRSFTELDQWLTLIERARGYDQMPTVLVGNKADLWRNREVSTEEGEQLAVKLGCPFLEVSALNRSGVDEAFSELVREIRRKEKEDQFKRISDSQEDTFQFNSDLRRSKRCSKKKHGFNNVVCKALRKLCNH